MLRLRRLPPDFRDVRGGRGMSSFFDDKVYLAVEKVWRSLERREESLLRLVRVLLEEIEPSPTLSNSFRFEFEGNLRYITPSSVPIPCELPSARGVNVE